MKSDANQVLQTHRLTKSYRGYAALNSASIGIRRGDIYGIVGKNGAGKTTLMKLITGLTEPSSGELALFGEARDLQRMRARIGAIVEQPDFFPYFSGPQNLEYFRIQRGIAEKEAVEKALAAVELRDAGEKKFKAYSLGMKQRLGMALALMGSPDFLILDEPINGIDPEGIVHIRNLIKKLNRERKMTILISSHILAELANLATRFAIIDRGVVLEELTAEELAAKTGSYLRIRVDEPKLALAYLEQELGLSRFWVDQAQQIILEEGIERSAEISALLVGRGLALHEIACCRSSLEDYFMQKIGEVHRD